MEAGEYGLTRRTCFVPRRLGVVSVAGMIWISWCVYGASGIRFIYVLDFFLRTRTACCNFEATLPDLRPYKYRLRGLYEAGFHKPGIHGSGRAWANARDVFRRTCPEVVAVAGLLWNA